MSNSHKISRPIVGEYDVPFPSISDKEQSWLFNASSGVRQFLTFATTGVLALSSSNINASSILNNSNSFSKEISHYIKSISSNIEDINYINAYSFVKKSNFLTEILSFRTLEDNWDGFGAIPIEAQCASNAILLIDNLQEAAFNNISYFRPTSNGTVVFEWCNENNEKISLEVDCTGISYFVKYNTLEPLFFDDRKIEDNHDIDLLASYIESL